MSSGLQAVEHDLACMLFVFWRKHIVDEQTNGENSEDDTGNNDNDVDSLRSRVFWLRSELDSI